ncbi:MAG TPA: hypothetical protein P5110_06065 [Candidatus Omnitrophota bacterium]|nr:hypothetical protein [Candidatus Omnitrophota bacterium]HRZ15060.1 hypothetical protein [Candidatus Omnitrophota bacterium]
MRDLLFKNLTSTDRKRKVLSCSEVVDKSGLRTIIRRHFIYVVREVPSKPKETTAPSLHILKERNSLEKREHFFCKMRGSVYAVYQNRIYLINFMHTLKINLTALPEGLMKYTEE